MKKSDARALFGSWFAEWRNLPEQRGTPEQELDVDDFLRWLGAEHPGALEFRSRAGAAYDVEMWFAHATHQSWKY